MYGKIFESIYDGSLAADWKSMITFQQMIILADQNGIVDITPPSLSRRTGIPLEIIEHGVRKLQEPDPYSRSNEDDGRRISLLDDHRSWGWQIVNYMQYRNLASRQDRANQSTERSRRWREKKASENNNETPGDAQQRRGRHVDVDTDVDISPPEAEIASDKKAPIGLVIPDSMFEQMQTELGRTRDELEKQTVIWRDHAFQRSTWDWLGRWRNWMRTHRWPAAGHSSSDSYHEEIRQAVANADE